MSEDDLKMGRRILGLPMGPNDADAVTVRGYLSALLTELWDLQEGFSGKRPFGNSGWSSELEVPLIEAGIVDGKLDYGDGYCYVDECDSESAHHLIVLAIKALVDPQC